MLIQAGRGRTPDCVPLVNPARVGAQRHFGGGRPRHDRLEGRRRVQHVAAARRRRVTAAAPGRGEAAAFRGVARRLRRGTRAPPLPLRRLPDASTKHLEKPGSLVEPCMGHARNSPREAIPIARPAATTGTGLKQPARSRPITPPAS